MRRKEAGTAGHTLGHNKTDQKFFEVYGDDLEVIDAPEELPWAARLKFTGDPSEVGSLFVAPNPEKRCVGSAWVRDVEGSYVVHDVRDEETGETRTVRMTRPCWNWRIRGGKVCHKHGGSITRVKEAAQIRMLCAADAVVGELIMIAMDPSQDGKVRVAAINSILDRTGIKAGVDVNVDVKGYEKLLKGWMDGGLDAAEGFANG